MADEVLDQNTTTRVQGGVDFKVVILKDSQIQPVCRATTIISAATCIFRAFCPVSATILALPELGNYDKTSLLAEDFLNTNTTFRPSLI